VTPTKSANAQSWAKKQVQDEWWDLVYLRYCADIGVLQYYADERKREEPLGEIRIQETERTDNVLRMGAWTLKFETKALCKAWKHVLVVKQEEEEFAVRRPSDKLDNQRLIDAARKRHRRRKSIGEEWEDDEEALHFERVMELLKSLNL